MQIEQAKIGMQVYFGRSHGEKTLGKIIKLNPTKAKVETLEGRGNGRGGIAGSVWSVPYSMMEPAGEATAVAAAAPTLKYNPFQSRAEQLILQAIGVIYGELSPENLTADGELPASRVREKSATLHRQLRGLFAAFGRKVTEDEVWNWEKQREADVNRPR
jgi:hypothetical protein